MKKAIAYHRFSKDGQSNSSIERQDMITSDWAKYSKVSIIDTFSDEGYSAKNFDRPDLKKLFDFIKKNYLIVDYLIVSELTRFSREAGDALMMVKKIQDEYNIKIVSAQRGAIYDYYDHNSYFMMGLEFIQGTAENIKRQNDINGGIYTAKAKEGRYIGARAPYGYHKIGEGKNKRLDIIDKEAQTVRLIYSRFLAGVPQHEILKEVKNTGLPQRDNDIIHSILINPIYTGLLKVKPWKDKPGGLLSGSHPPIIDRATWNMVQEKFKQPARRVSFRDDLPLRGVLHCHCGKCLTGAASRGRHGGQYLYYNCQMPGHNTIPAAKAHSQMDEIMELISLPSRIITAIQKGSDTAMKQRLQQSRKEMQEKTGELEQTNQDIFSVERKWMRDQLAYESYLRLLGELTAKRSILQHQIRKLGQDQDQVWILLQQNLHKLGDMKFLWNNGNTLQKHEIIKKGFDNRLYYENGSYRTPFLLPIFSLNPMITNKKGLIEIIGLPDKPGQVELRGFEPLSKHIPQKLSTCLFPYCLSALHRKRTNQCNT